MIRVSKKCSIVFISLIFFSILEHANGTAFFGEGSDGLELAISGSAIAFSEKSGTTSTFELDNDKLRLLKISSTRNCKDFLISKKSTCENKLVKIIGDLKQVTNNSWACAGTKPDSSVTTFFKELPADIQIDRINSIFQSNRIDLRASDFLKCLEGAKHGISTNNIRIYCNKGAEDQLRCNSDKKILFMNKPGASNLTFANQIFELCGVPGPFLTTVYDAINSGSSGVNLAAVPDEAQADQRDQPINVPKPPQEISCPGCSKAIDEVRVAQQDGTWNSPQVREELTANLRRTFAAPIRTFTAAFSPTSASAGSDSGTGSVRRPSSTNTAGLDDGRGGSSGRASSVGKSANKANTKSEVLDPTAIGPNGERINYFDDKQGSVRADKVSDSSNAPGSTTDPKSDVGVSGLSGPSKAESASPGVNPSGASNAPTAATADRPRVSSEAARSNSLNTNGRYSPDQIQILNEIRTAAESSKTLPSELVSQPDYANKLKENGIRVIFAGKPGSIGAEKNKGAQITVVIKSPPALNKNLPAKNSVREKESVQIID